jgi:hypothetical protein
VVFLTAFTAACDRQAPRTFNDFMDDPIARDGTIARCNQDRDTTVNDLECANARRAAAAVAVREERERSAALEMESERKLRELRLRAERAEEAARLAAEEAAARERAEYEAQWADEPANSAQSVNAEVLQQTPAPAETVADSAAPPQAPPPSTDLLQRARQRPSELVSSPTRGASAEPSTAGAEGGEPGIVPRPFRDASGATP